MIRPKVENHTLSTRGTRGQDGTRGHALQVRVEHRGEQVHAFVRGEHTPIDTFDPKAGERLTLDTSAGDERSVGRGADGEGTAGAAGPDAGDVVLGMYARDRDLIAAVDIHAQKGVGGKDGTVRYLLVDDDGTARAYDEPFRVLLGAPELHGSIAGALALGDVVTGTVTATNPSKMAVAPRVSVGVATSDDATAIARGAVPDSLANHATHTARFAYRATPSFTATDKPAVVDTTLEVSATADRLGQALPGASVHVPVKLRAPVEVEVSIDRTQTPTTAALARLRFTNVTSKPVGGEVDGRAVRSTLRMSSDGGTLSPIVADVPALAPHESLEVVRKLHAPTVPPGGSFDVTHDLSMELAPSAAPTLLQTQTSSVHCVRPYEAFAGPGVVVVTKGNTPPGQLAAWDTLARELGLSLTEWSTLREGPMRPLETVNGHRMLDEAKGKTLVFLDGADESLQHGDLSVTAQHGVGVMLMNGARSLKDELTLHAAETTTVSAARNGSLAAAAVTSHETRYALCKALPFAQKLVSFAHVLSSTNPTAHPMRQPLIDAIAADLAEEQTKLITDTTSSPRTLDERLARFHALGALRVPQAPFGSPQADVVASLVGRVDAFLTDAQKTFGALRQYPLAEPLARARGCLDALEERALDKKGRKHAARVGKETRNESKLLERKTAERARYSAALRPAGHRVESAFDVYRRPTDARRHPG